MKGPARSGPRARAASSAQPAASVVRGRRISIMGYRRKYTGAYPGATRPLLPPVRLSLSVYGDETTRFGTERPAGERDAQRDSHGHERHRLDAARHPRGSLGWLVLLRQGGAGPASALHRGGGAAPPPVGRAAWL